MQTGPEVVHRNLARHAQVLGKVGELGQTALEDLRHCLINTAFLERGYNCYQQLMLPIRAVFQLTEPLMQFLQGIDVLDSSFIDFKSENCFVVVALVNGNGLDLPGSRADDIFQARNVFGGEFPGCTQGIGGFGFRPLLIGHHMTARGFQQGKIGAAKVSRIQL